VNVLLLLLLNDADHNLVMYVLQKNHVSCCVYASDSIKIWTGQQYIDTLYLPS